jgi:hypothetical protein
VKKGEDPAADAFEKQLQRLATKGVVLLFNAVNKAQKQQAEAKAAGKKASKATRAGLLAELKASSQLPGATAPVGQPGVLKPLGMQQQQEMVVIQQQRQQQGQQQADSDDEGLPGWDVLGESIPGLTGGSKMKDWDKQMEQEEEYDQEQIAGSDDDDDDGDEGW